MAKKRCPAKHCPKFIGVDYAFCPRHWYMVPQDLRNKIWKLFREEQGSMDHLQALADARKLIEETEAKLKGRDGSQT